MSKLINQTRLNQFTTKIWSKIKEKTLSQRKKNEQRTGKSQKKTGKESSC